MIFDRETNKCFSDAFEALPMPKRYTDTKNKNTTPHAMQLFVKTLTGTTLTVDTQPTNTIADLKQSIYRNHGIHPDDGEANHGGGAVSAVARGRR